MCHFHPFQSGGICQTYTCWYRRWTRFCWVFGKQGCRRAAIPRISKPPVDLRHSEISDEDSVWPTRVVLCLSLMRTMNTAPERVDEESARGPAPAQEPVATSDSNPTPNPPIPSYETATGVAPPVLPTAPPQNGPSGDELPDYTPVDENQTTFMIYGTFIYSPNGPAYQLSSLLDARIAKLRIRRLRAEDIAMIEAGRSRNVAFDSASVLYEAHDPPFLQNEYYIQSKTSNGWQGGLQMRFGFRHWHIRQVMQQGVTPQDMLTCGKEGALKKRILQRKNELEPSVWKDTKGVVLATEVLRLEDGRMLPTIELTKDLTQMWRELLLALWVSRLWAGFGAGTG